MSSSNAFNNRIPSATIAIKSRAFQVYFSVVFTFVAAEITPLGTSIYGLFLVENPVGSIFM